MPVKQKWFIFFAMLCGFFIGGEYAIVRPVSNALFITAYTSSFLPYAWLATVPLNLLLVSLYNQYLPRLGCWKMFQVIASTIVFGNLFFACFLKSYAFLPFIFYIWKEIYILLILQQLWSVIHASVDFKRAKYLYGVLFGAGAFGAVCGSSLPSFFAVKVGSENLLYTSFPIYCCLALFYWFLLKNSGTVTPWVEKKESPLAAFRYGMGLIKNSKLLMFILIIVACMQMAATLIDYQFNAVLEKMVSGKDLRTEYTARVLGVIHLITLSLQLFGAFLIVHFFGLKKSHFLIPCVLGVVSLGFLLVPIFPMVALSYMLVKSFDFSLFGVIKEMLYIPMSQDEKFRAKSIIDVFAYRSSKAIASLLILSLQIALGAYLLPVISWLLLGLFIFWSLAVLYLFNPKHSIETATGP